MEGQKFCCALTFIVTLNILKFCAAVSYTVQEEGVPNSFIGNIARDFNLTSHGKSLRFSFINTDKPYYSFFNISETSGELYTVGVLDREEICEFTSKCDILLEIVVTATKVSFFQKSKVNVIIEDINDHTPEFPVDTISLTISESVVVGTSVTIDGATDPDSQQFSVRSYNIVTPGSPFSVKSSQNLDGSSSVQIIVDVGLDREKVDNYQVQIVAVDGGVPPKTGTVHVNITVKDTNDNFPEFSSAIYNITVKEDIPINSTILQVTANDDDSAENGEITYSIATHQSADIKDLFTIDSSTGEIRTIGQLVFSPDHQYKIIVEASDGATQPHTTQAFVYVQVQDVGNNPPKININLLSSTNYAKVSELADIEAVVALIGVTDDDVGMNGVTNCSLHSQMFSLQRSEIDEYKVIVSKPLNRELHESHNVTVFCHDVGIPPLNSSKNFMILVIDENDHQPVFSSSIYSTEIMENNNYGDVVLQVSASDEDSGKNAKIHYELQVDAWPHFSIEPDQGIIHAMKTFDREDKSEYVFHVLAIDEGDDPHTATATVSLKIGDKNDNKPVFTQAYYEFRVGENQPSGAVAGQVSAVDLDAENNGIVTYTISEDYEITVPFRLEPNGFLKTKTGLDREKQSRYDFTVVATDQGSPHRLNSTVNVSVFVSDVNDNSPYIKKPEKSGHLVHVSLSTPVNTPLYVVEAHDMDEGRNAELIFKIEERNDTYIFDINDGGQVLVARVLEKSDVNLYMIQIAVYDNGNPRNFAKVSLMMSVVTANATASSSADDGLHSQNLLIALTVVIVTAVLAATIVVTIFVIRRMDKRKREFFGDTNSDGSVEAEVVPGLIVDGHKDFYCRPNNSVQLAPVMSHMSLDRSSTTKDFIYKPRMDTPTPSSGSSGDIVDGDLQIRDGSETHDTSTPGLNRLASLRLHQALMQSNDKQWTSPADMEGQADMYNQQQNAEDSHSQLSGDGDSGRGGSVSDGHSNMGISHDGDDLRILQLQNIVRQSGRRGTPPHPPRPSSSHLADDICNKQSSSSCHNSQTLPPREPLKSQSSFHKEHGNDSRSVNDGRSVNFANTTNDIFYVPNSEKSKTNVQRYPSYSEKNSNRNTNYSPSYSSPRGKSSPGIQMGLSSFSSQYQSHPLKDSHYRVPRQHSTERVENYPHIHNYPLDQNKMNIHSNRLLDETMDSIATTAYDDEDNTTTSGSYTIDNNGAEDFVELNVAQLKDIFV